MPSQPVTIHMPFISFAQNFEDVMLFRALKHVQHGTYIDVGANDPVFLSVTKAFYERGWRGINIEPERKVYEKLKLDRPEDINLQVAAASSSGSLRFFELVDGLSTMDSEIASGHARRGFTVTDYMVPTKSLDAICSELDVRQVHFMKVDVEGYESSVLEGISLTSVRPWIIVVEAIEPISREPSHEKWEPLLTTRGYKFAYFDGLNRFYVAEEHASLQNAFSTPPNVFDDFIRFSEWQALLPHYTLRLCARICERLPRPLYSIIRRMFRFLRY
jgi:FkbM family methyltransferase